MKNKFNIPEEELEELRSISNKEFDEWCNIEGQFELIINNIRFGYVDNDVPFANELIISWLKILNNVALKLKENSNIVVFYIPDSTRWLEIIVDKEILHINEIEPIEKNIEFLITDKNYSNLFKYCNKSELIDKNDFIYCIVNSSRNFINYISNINEDILLSKTMKELINQM